MGYRQIELSVVADNARAIALYRHLGFREMGRVPRALCFDDGHCSDELWMVKMLDP